MKNYICHLIFEADPMVRRDYHDKFGMEPPSDGGSDAGYIVAHQVRGMRLEEWIGKNEFDAEYRETTKMAFGMAIEALKSGHRVARAGWNGKGMWLVLINPGNAMHASAAGKFPMLPCIGMKTAQDDMLPGWLASQTDMLAEDWCIVE